ncbi:TRAP transporter large permease [Acuticoccus sp. I52.16.1]|uniref:TRAP transporter large permease n=1 Tax=Acuticoccus sp. I52.16.1 TaxID=2928472 RepID=UPI001FD4AE0B|nr:TRAP transporter large permease [Acuticoccus sp. I52.16.1]UOM36591.1 TRAP transporter large permease [Acuticoccus sp. I52.16.1]
MIIFAALFGTLLVLLFLGVSVGLSLIGASLAVLAYARGLGEIPFEMLAQRTLYGVNSFTLLAIPAFLLIGRLMNDSGIADRVFNIARAIVGPVRGGLGHVNVLSSMLFAGMSGSAVADAGGLGPVQMKAMEKDGYVRGFAAAVTVSSSTIGPIIPPSIAAVIYGAIANVSIAAVFIGSILPGILMGVSLMVLVAIISHRRKYPVGPRVDLRTFATAIGRGILPILTPVIIIAGILSGLFTPTEASAVALVYCMAVAFLVYRTITLRQFWVICLETAKDTATLLLIIAGSALYAWVLARYQVNTQIVDFLSNNIGNKYLLLILLNVFLLVVGCFIDAVPALFMLTPLLVPLIAKFGIDPVHFGVVMIINLMIGLITPPVGTVLFTVQKVADIPFGVLVKEVAPFYIPLFVVLLLVTFVPWLVLGLPGLLL